MHSLIVYDVIINPCGQLLSQEAMSDATLNEYEAWGLIPGRNHFRAEPVTIILTNLGSGTFRVTTYRRSDKDKWGRLVFEGPARCDKDPLGVKYVIQTDSWIYDLYF